MYFVKFRTQALLSMSTSLYLSMSLAMTVPIIDGEDGDYFILYFTMFGILNLLLAANYTRH
jgi:hypothetical protein